LSSVTTVFSAALLAGVVSAFAPPANAEIVGPAFAVDGDTLDVNGLRVRLFGIDAPESDQTCRDAKGAEWDCGSAATARLVELVTSGDVACEPRDRDKYGRVVADCSAGGIHINATLVSEGLAWAYARFSMEHVEAEDRARAEGVGIWQGPAEVAWEYRSGGWSQAAAVVDDGPGHEDCPIKGNINAKGERIYHTPSSPWYSRTSVNESKGQRWFCDAAAAEAAGWRPVGGAR